MMKQLRLVCLSVMLVFSTVALAKDTLRIYAWSEYFAPGLLQRFEEQNNTQIVYDVYDSNEMLEAKLYAGKSGYDVIFPTNYPYFIRQQQAGILKPLDESKIPNLKYIDERFLQPLKINNKIYGVPYMWGTIGFAYNEEKVKQLLGDKADLDSWNILFEPENLKKLSGCGVAMMDSAIYIYPILLNYLGLDPNSTDPQDYQKALNKLQAIRPYVTYFHGSQQISDLANGNVCLAVSWSGDLIMARDRAAKASKPIKIQYVNPKEGSLFGYDVIAILEDSKSDELACKFINYLAEPKNMAENTNYMGYPNPESAAKQYVEPAILDDKGIYPDEETQAKFFTLKLLPLPIEKQINRDWLKLKAGG